MRSTNIAAGFRHFEGADWLFADGHAKFLMPENVSGGNNPLLNTCYQDGSGCGGGGVTAAAAGRDTITAGGPGLGGTFAWR